MGVGLSDGTYHEDYTTMVAMAMPIPDSVRRVPIVKDDVVTPPDVDQGMVVNPNEFIRGKELDAAELDPSTGLGVDISFKRPLGDRAEPADALKPVEGSQVPGNEQKAENDVDWSRLNQPFGSIKGTAPVDTPVVAKTANGLITITEGDIAQATNVGMSAGPASIAGIKGISALPAYAKEAALTKLGHARVLEGQAAHADEIWQQTGFFRGADGRWKYEIPDKDAVLKESGFHKNIIPNDPRVGGEENITYSIKRAGFAKVEDILDHPKLFEAYPFLKNIQIAEHENAKTTGTAYIGANRLSFKDDLDPEYLRGVLLHELQHFIQYHEGFAGGSSSKAFKPSTFDARMEQYEKAIAEGADPHSAEMKEFRKAINESFDVAIEKYKRVMGEVEARNVQTRRDFNEVKRHYNSPPTTEDRPRFVQINPENYTPTQSMQGP